MVSYLEEEAFRLGVVVDLQEEVAVLQVEVVTHPVEGAFHPEVVVIFLEGEILKAVGVKIPLEEEGENPLEVEAMTLVEVATLH